VKLRAVLLAVAAAAVAGCGGSSRLSHDELARRAGKICAVQARTIEQIPRGPSNAINAAGYLGAVLSVVEDGVKQFHRLEPSKADESLYNAFLRELDRNTNLLRELRAAAAARDRRDYVVGLARLHRSRLRIDALDRRLGFSGCAAAAGSS
jgi:hypothetical protein